MTPPSGCGWCCAMTCPGRAPEWDPWAARPSEAAERPPHTGRASFEEPPSRARCRLYKSMAGSGLDLPCKNARLVATRMRPSEARGPDCGGRSGAPQPARQRGAVLLSLHPPSGSGGIGFEPRNYSVLQVVKDSYRRESLLGVSVDCWVGPGGNPGDPSRASRSRSGVASEPSMSSQEHRGAASEHP